MEDNFFIVNPLPVVILPIADIPFIKAEIATAVPPLPGIHAEAIATLTVVTLAVEDIPFIKAEIVTALPALPGIHAEEIATLTVIQLPTEDIPFIKAEMVVTLPPLPLVPAETITTFRIVKLPADIPFSKAEIVTTLPPLPPVPSETMTIRPVITFHTGDVPFSKAEIVTLSKFEVKRTPVAEMHLSPEGYSLLQKLEGYSPELYSLNDGGFTIGFGFFVPYGEGAKWNKGITWDEAERLMQQKVPAYEDQVKEYVNVPLTQYEFDALTMLAYNIGGFSKATSIINDINNQAGFEKLQSDWKRFVHSKAPNVSKGLMNRRKDELEVRELANYQPERKIQILKPRK